MQPTNRRPGAANRAGVVFGHLGVILAVAVVMGLLTAGLLVPVAAFVGYSGRSAVSALSTLPQALKTQPMSQRTRVLDADGHLMTWFYDQDRVPVPLSRIAPVMRKAIVSIEDYRFYQHGALDVKGTLRALVNNQTSGSTQGGSSITQQMAKMTALGQAGDTQQQAAATADTYQRKITELRHAIAFEKHYSKSWILDRYLNLAYFGSGAYGIQSAARRYFSVDAKDLDTAQAALLAGLVKNPVGYDPVRFPTVAKARRNVVLARMAQLHVIGRAEARTLSAQPLGLHRSSTANGCIAVKIGAFYCDYVRRYLLSDPSLGKTVADRLRLLQTGGLTIKTNIGTAYQYSADQATSSAVNATDEAIGALAMVQPGTGRVIALSQSRPMGRDRAAGETFLNYTVDQEHGDSAGFPGGSTFKLFVLATALEMGIPPTTTIYSPHRVHLVDSQFQDCKGPYRGAGTWDPANSTVDGTFDMYKGMQESVNTFFAQLETRTGICRPFALARAMGVHLTNPGGDKAHAGAGGERTPSFTLGSPNVSPLEMAGAYATPAARGVYCAPHPVSEILNSQRKLFKRYAPECRRVMSQHTADVINDILRGVMAPGGFGQNLMLAIPSAGKTGTTQDNAAVWFDGYTPALATSAMIAGANSQGTPISLNGQIVGGSYVGTAHGSTLAGPMWADAMRRVEAALPNTDFVHP